MIEKRMMVLQQIRSNAEFLRANFLAKFDSFDDEMSEEFIKQNFFGDSLLKEGQEKLIFVLDSIKEFKLTAEEIGLSNNELGSLEMFIIGDGFEEHD